MKPWWVIIVCFIASIFLYLYFWDDLNIVVNKSYKFFGCKVKYKQSVLSSDYHRLNDNIYEQESAKYKLAQCLCEKYAVTRDSAVGNFILAFFKNDEYSQRNYVSGVVFNYMDTSFLIENFQKIFQDDPRFLQIIKKCANRKSEEFVQELINNLGNSYWADYRFNELLNAIPVDNPPLDTIVKHRELVFKIPGSNYGY
jgi:hypothetical protein